MCLLTAKLVNLRYFPQNCPKKLEILLMPNFDLTKKIRKAVNK